MSQLINKIKRGSGDIVTSSYPEVTGVRCKGSLSVYTKENTLLLASNKPVFFMNPRDFRVIVYLNDVG